MRLFEPVGLILNELALKESEKELPLACEEGSFKVRIMKKLVLVAILLAAVAAAQAQVKVEIQFDGEQFIANEPLIARVRIVNDSGATLHLGETADWLS